MRLVFISVLVMSGCVSTDPLYHRIHMQAKKSDFKTCYRIKSPEDIAGKYCLEFKEENRVKDKFILVQE